MVLRAFSGATVMSKIWSVDPDSEHYTTGRNLSLAENPDGYWKITEAVSLAGRFPDTTIEITSDHTPADHFVVGGIFIVSDRLKSILEQSKVRAEYFPLHVVFEGKDYTDRRFFYCNLLEEIECFDFQHGKCTMWKKPGFTDRIKTIKKLAIDDKKASLHPLFRLAKCSPTIVVANDDLAEKIVESECTGIRLIRPEKWKFGI
jgi:hypothetical protein